MVLQLQRAGITPTDYLSFHGKFGLVRLFVLANHREGLRNWGVLDAGPVCSQIYVHCKCMIGS